MPKEFCDYSDAKTHEVALRSQEKRHKTSREDQKGVFVRGGISIIGVVHAPVAISHFASNPGENFCVFRGFNKELPHKKHKINYCNRCAHDANYWDLPSSQKKKLWKLPRKCAMLACDARNRQACQDQATRNACDSVSRCVLACDVSAGDAKSLTMWVNGPEPLRARGV